MTRKKVGGRESGKPSGQSRVEESGGVPAAANPAARPICFCNGNFYESRAQYYLKEAIWLHERIRALEARVMELLLENDALRQADDEHHQEAGR